MQFKSVGTSDYSQAAKAVTGNMDSIYNTARNTATDFTKIAKAAINTKRIQKEAVMKADDIVNRQGMVEAGAAKERNILKDAIKDARNITRPAKRMAGLVAGLGAVSTAYIQKKEMDRDAADRAELRGLRLANERRAKELHDSYMDLNRTRMESQEGEITDLKTRIKEQEEELGTLRGGNPNTSGTPNTDAEGNTSQITPPKTSVSSNLQTASTPSTNNLAWKALGSTIQLAEGTLKPDGKGYRTGYGHNMFTDLSKHPDTVWRTDGGSSAAAGAYQFMPETWGDVVKATGVSDFSPQSQEIGGQYLTTRAGVDISKPFTKKSELIDAFHKLSPTWAGLPNRSGLSHYEGYNGNSSYALEPLIQQYESVVGYKLQ